MLTRLWPSLFWLTIAIAAAGALVLEWRRPPHWPLPSAVKPPDPVTVPPLQPFRPSPLSRYTEIVDRPVFIDTRRPEEEDLAAPPPPPNPDRPLNLIGVVLIPQAAAALLRPEEPNAKVLRIPQGGMVDDWRLETVQADKVVLRKGREARELILIRPPSPPRPIPPANAVSRTLGMPPPPPSIPMPRS